MFGRHPGGSELIEQAKGSIWKSSHLAMALCVVTVGLLPAGKASAQASRSFGVTLEAATDLRDRGISWSDGQSALRLDATVPLSPDFAIDARAVTLRGSDRHGGSDLGLAVSPNHQFHVGGWRLSAGVTGHLFVGEIGLHYIELDGAAARSIGPLQVSAGVSFAPSQDAIGGRNLYVHADAVIGIPGSPLTIYGGAGHTTGSGKETPRARRLRPEGDYSDWYAGAEHVYGPAALGLRYSDTTVGGLTEPGEFTDGDTGARLIAYARVSF